MRGLDLFGSQCFADYPAFSWNSLPHPFPLIQWQFCHAQDIESGGNGSLRAITTFEFVGFCLLINRFEHFFCVHFVLSIRYMHFKNGT